MLGTRIKEAAERVGGLDELSQLTGIKRRTLGDYVSGKTEPRISVLLQIADVTDADLDWLIRDPASGSGTFLTAMVQGDFVAVPRLDIRASAGNGRLAVMEDAEAQIVAFKQEWLRKLGVNPKNAQIIVAEGDSMEPTIGHGDLVLIDRSVDHVVDEGIYVLVYAGMVKLKRVQVLLSGTVLLKSDNPAYQTEEVDVQMMPEQLIIEGRVRWAGGAI